MIDQDVLMMAGMVNGSLNNIEKMMESRSSIAGPVNKLNLPNILHQNRAPGTASAVNNPAYVSEEVVQRLVPDTSVLSKPPNNLNDSVQVTFQPQPDPKVEGVVTAKLPEKTSSELAEDIKTIKSTLLRIDSTFTKISGMLGKVFNHITQK